MNSEPETTGRRGAGLSDPEKLRLILEMLDLLPDFVYAHDRDLRFQFANRSAAEYFGLEAADQIIGSRLKDLEPDKDQAEMYERICREVMASGVPRITDRLPLRLPDGSTRYLRQHDVPFTHPVTGEAMLFGLSRDITDEVDLEQERLRTAELEREMALARQIQRSTWPQADPDATGLNFAASSEPAAFAGGDLYDWWTHRGRVQVCIGDATGHGVGAALMAAECRAYARALLGTDAPLNQSMKTLSQLMSRHGEKGRFVTFLSMMINPQTGAAEMFSCGHGPVFHVRHDGEIQDLPTHALPLGLDPDAEADQPQPATSFQLEPGDALVLVTDGAFELRRTDGEQFGIQRLKSTLHSLAGRSSAAIHSALTASIHGFRDRAPLADDTTVVVVSRGR